MSLLDRIEGREAKAAVVGLGYVGLPLAVELARAGYSVVGVDVDEDKIKKILAGESYVGDVDSSDLAQFVTAGKLTATTDESALADCDAVSICVPTPLRKTKDPDLSYVMDAAQKLAAHLHPEMLIILESTTYPGTTEEAILPVLAESGLEVGKDFFLCFSPERADPGNTQYTTRTIPKVIGGVTSACLEYGVAFYSKALDHIAPVSSTRVAEMVKLLENTFRMINIGLANEMAMMCDRMGINVWEVIEAAATKPFGFMPFYPGPGLGGHCIPVDPHYLSWKIKQAGYEPRFIALASEINGQMPQFVVDKVQSALNSARKAVNGSRIHIMGVAYKRDVGDTRESPALDIIGLLERLGAKVTFTDPFVAELPSGLQSQPLEPGADCVVVVTDHSETDYKSLVEQSSLIVDSRNALKNFDDPKIIRL